MYDEITINISISNIQDFNENTFKGVIHEYKIPRVKGAHRGRIVSFAFSSLLCIFLENIWACTMIYVYANCNTINCTYIFNLFV